MKEELIADIWNLMIEHIPDKVKKDVASDFVNTLLDYGVKDSTIESLLGIDPFLDDAISYAIDGEDIVDSNDEDYADEEE